MYAITAFCASTWGPRIKQGISQRPHARSAVRPPIVAAVASGEAILREGKVEVADNVEVMVNEGMENHPIGESSITCIEDIEAVLELVDAFGVADLRLEDGDVVIEVTRPGGRGFEQDGRLAKIETGSAVGVLQEEVVQHVVEQVVEGEEEEEEEEEEQDVDAAEDTEGDPEKVYESDFVVRSNRVGFFFSGAKNKPPLVMVGDHVDFNQPVCIIEQLGQQYVYLSEASGTVFKIFVEDGDVVEYGQQVMVIRPD